tara:strand:- start:822 stop:989 length:168 start_codon:yes stop_codon:yes gene_type:complete
MIGMKHMFSHAHAKVKQRHGQKDRQAEHNNKKVEPNPRRNHSTKQCEGSQSANNY